MSPENPLAALRIVRQPRHPEDLERGFYAVSWYGKTAYACLFCHWDTFFPSEMPEHHRQHLQRLALSQLPKTRPLGTPLFDANGKLIESVEL